MNKAKLAPSILAIESSCDETAVAIYQEKLSAHALHSQIARHQLYGGVVPELASRDHLTHIMPLVKNALAQVQLQLSDIDVFAYTKGPGLAGCLLVGATVAKSLAFAQKKPSLAIHHLEGHLLAPFLEKNDLAFPYLALLVSGGHTQFIAVEDIGKYHILGDTLDDALGEAFDKTAKMLGLPYPGGAEVSKKAECGQAIFDLPTPMLHSKNLEMSFAGLKTAVLYLIQAQKQIAIAAGLISCLDENLPENISNDICASFVQSIVKVMQKKTTLALDLFRENFLHDEKIAHLVITGGVGANLQLRATLQDVALQKNAKLFYPAIQWCTDNAAMIAVAAHLKLKNSEGSESNDFIDFDKSFAIEVKPRWSL